MSDSDSKKQRQEDFEPQAKEGVYPASLKTGVDNRFLSTTYEHRKLEPWQHQFDCHRRDRTALFVYMGSGLTAGGPSNLLLGYIFFCAIVWCVAEGQKELVTQWPTDSALLRYASRYVDDAAGFALGWNFWLSQVALVVFEVVAFTIVLDYWAAATTVSPAVPIACVIIAYTVLNVWDARFFANAEFGFAMGKILLITGLIIMTFITMLGGNPLKDRFGFRFWRDPGPMTGPYPEHGHSTSLFEGFLACFINAAFTVAGPDYLSMVAGEARNPRKVMPKAFNATVYRLIVFFIGSALCIGILVPYDDANLLGAQASGAPGAAKSPYVIAMRRLMIPVLPEIVNALILTSVFSAGNAYLFCGARSLAVMARDGQAPAFLGKRNRNGVPFFAVLACLSIGLLAFCQVSSSAVVVVTYLTGLVGSAQLVNWQVMSFTWIRWNAGMKAQGISRDTLHCRSIFQPYAAWFALFGSTFVLLLNGYTVFLSGAWDTPSFIFAYFAPALYVVLFIGWKLIKKSKWEGVASMDLTSFYDDAEFTEFVDYATLENRGKAGVITEKVLSTIF
ncbi:amino acid permease/ SLC12A domain-containing protein [Leucosporidium creatinivorum]|uniref:Amino acid permease/ SLC12A domain-containing protein n=1 Tax=Leucosporidium creatinivorum TaxID=106004 RepID=A0A1Y2G3G0_9BASI|nr:amino acid permease/ SLC12A domain-containing protein [Leucosporidium creatinivorum]